MKRLEDALSDLLREVQRGCNFERTADEIANDYELNPILLKRKFAERHGTAESVPAKANMAAEYSRTTAIDYHKAEEFLRSECLRHGLNPNFFLPIKGKKKVVIKYLTIDSRPCYLVADFNRFVSEWLPIGATQDF